MGGGGADYNDWIIRVTITDKVVSLITTHCNVYLKQVYVIKFFSVLLQTGGFIQGTLVSSTKRTDRHEINEILLKVVLNIKTL